MTITIGSNIPSLRAQRQLGAASNSLTQSLQRLSSGQRINTAADDAAGLAISSSLNADRRVFTQAVRNLNDGLSLLAIADGAVEQLSSIVTRQRELATQAANGTYGTTQRQALDTEAQALSAEYFRIARTTSFNGTKLFDGSIQRVVLQAGYGTTGTISASLGGKMGDATFGPASTFVGGDETRDILVRDFSGDGIADLGLLNRLSGTLSFMQGNGDGTFKAQTCYTVGQGASNGGTVDLNGDGILDIFSANTGSNNVSVLLGNGDGSFKAQICLAAGSDTQTAHAVDINKDGKLDIVAALVGSSAAAVFLGNGDGTFKARITSRAGDRPEGLAIADLNGTAGWILLQPINFPMI